MAELQLPKLIARVRFPSLAPCDVSGHCERLNPRFWGSTVFHFWLVGLFWVDCVVADDGAIEVDDGRVCVVDQDDDLGAGVGSPDSEVEHSVAVA